jgi:hypothetical protein
MTRDLSILATPFVRRAGRRFCASILFLAAATLLLWTANASAQTDGRLFFLNPGNGDYLIGGIDPSGYFHSTPAGTRSTLVGTTHLVANNTAIVAYNKTTGYAELVAIDGYGHAGFRPTGFGVNWNFIVATGGNFLTYAGNGNDSGQAAAFAVKQGGYIDHQIWAGSLSPWTNIVQTGDYLIFYNQVTGLFDATIFSPVSSNLEQNSLSVATIPTDYGVMAAVDDNVILYNSTTGAFRIVSMYFIGNGNDFPDRRDTGTLAKFYGAILPSAGRVVFYSYGSGDVLVAHLTQSGELVSDKKTKIPIYTDAFTTGSYLCFYNAENGELAVYSLSTGGTLTRHSVQQIGSGYTFTAAAHS